MPSGKRAVVQYWGLRGAGRVALTPPLQLAVAGTPALQAQGVRFWPSVPDGGGMFFVFKTPGPHSIWMQGVRFDLDVAWLDEHGRVLALRRLMAFDPLTVAPASNTKYVIELAAGMHDRHGVRVGDWAVRL